MSQFISRAYQWASDASSIEQQWQTVSGIEPHWADKDERAKLLRRNELSGYGHELILAPSKSWLSQGFSAGQWVQLGIEINGVVYHRCYSIASSPAEAQEQNQIRLGIGSKANGLVSNAVINIPLNSQISLGLPEGEFALKQPSANTPVFIAGGAGITPIRSMLIAALESYDKLILIYSVKSKDHAFYLQEFEQLQEIFPGFQFQLFCTDKNKDEYSGRITANTIKQLCLEQTDDSATVHFDFYVCGSHDFSQKIEQWVNQSKSSQSSVCIEAFSAPQQKLSGAASQIHFTRSGIQSSGDNQGSVLEIAEASGINAHHGCRMGICQQCQCKAEGTFKNIRNGELVEKQNQDIRICIYQAIGEVSLAI